MNEIQQRHFAMAEVRPMIGAHEARVNITWKGNNADLPDPVPFDATEGDVKQWVTEAVRAGIPGIPADPAADFRDFVVDRFSANDATPYNRLMIRPKTPFGTEPPFLDRAGEAMKKVVIVGVGALGSHVTQFLRNEAELKVIDFDRIEQKNVLAQFHSKTTIGRNKADALKQTMQFFWGLKLDAVTHKLTKENVHQLLGDQQLIIDCLDNGASRRVITEYIRYPEPEHEDPGAWGCGIDTLHGALAPDGQFGRVIWDDVHQFVVDDEGAAGAATCEGGEHLPFIGIVAAYIARAAQQYLKDGKKIGYVVTPAGVQRI